MKINVDATTIVAPLEPFWAGQCNAMIETSADGNTPLVTYMADVGIRYWRDNLWGGPKETWPEQDGTAEAILAAGAKPIVIVGVPGELFPTRKRDHLPRDRNPGPVDMHAWQEHVFEMVSYAVERFGAEEVSTWWWECTNEPAGPSGIELDIYCRIYDHFATGARRALPNDVSPSSNEPSVQRLVVLRSEHKQPEKLCSQKLHNPPWTVGSAPMMMRRNLFCHHQR